MVAAAPVVSGLRCREAATAAGVGLIWGAVQ